MPCCYHTQFFCVGWQDKKHFLSQIFFSCFVTETVEISWWSRICANSNTHRSLPSADIYKVMQLAKTPRISKHWLSHTNMGGRTQTHTRTWDAITVRWRQQHQAAFTQNIQTTAGGLHIWIISDFIWSAVTISAALVCAWTHDLSVSSLVAIFSKP